MIELLDRELAALGVPARRRRRIRLELEDHLACDPEADLGDPVELARRFADELGTAYARRAGFMVFVALVPVAVLFGLLLVAGQGANNVGTVLGTQLAFVGGTLALLRAWRLRRQVVIAASESRVLARRATLGIAGGLLTLVSIGVATHTVLSGVTIGTGCVSLGLAGVALRAARLRPANTGPAADFAFDLGLNADPWRLAIVVAAAVAFCIAAAGFVQADLLDGLVRAFGDGILCTVGFALLGRPLGLRA